MKDKFQQVFNLNDKEDHSNSFKIQQFVSSFGELVNCSFQKIIFCEIFFFL
jgi:hypothetical protein